jgi:hypothetical protein
MNDRAESCRKTSLPHQKTLPDHLIIKPLFSSGVHAAAGKLAFQRTV